MTPPLSGPATRRSVLAATAGSFVALGTTACRSSESPQPRASSAPETVSPYGAHQAGIHLPGVPQPHLLAVVLDVDGGRRDLGVLLADLGKAIGRVVSTALPGGVHPGDLTVTVGIGPRLVQLAGAGLPGSQELPRFRRERIADGEWGGDLLLQLCASDPLVPTLAATELALSLPRATRRWQQRGFRGAPEQVGPHAWAPRNGQGFHDGVVVPRTETERDEGVWIAAGPATGGTVAVVRRFAIDALGFGRLPTKDQEAAVGRQLRSGAPLSGGTVATEPNLNAKTPDGRYLIPADAHVRRSSALATGVPLMLRRGYPVDDPEPGLLFVSFQQELDTFVRTQQRMDESDRLLEFATATASASFLVLPGFTPGRPLGSTLFG